MILQDIINSDLQIIESDLGDQFITWQGEDYVCVPSGNGDTLTLQTGGFGEDIDMVIKVRIELFSDVYPRPQQKFIFNDITYRISKITQDVTGTFFVINGVDITRGV